MSQRETELKFLLTSSEHEALAGLLGSPMKVTNLINRYYSVPGGSERKDWVMRLRTLAEDKELTLKIGREISPGVFDSVEFSAMVDSDDPDTWKETEPMQRFREKISTLDLVVQGEAQTVRGVFKPPISIGAKWELDRLTLPDEQEIFELEIEVVFQSERELQEQRMLVTDWLSKNGFQVRPSNKTKYARFLQSLAGP